MKKIIYLFILLGFISCDYTDIKPTGETYPTDINALGGLLYGRYGYGSVEDAALMLPMLELPENLPLGSAGILSHDRAYGLEDFFYNESESSFNFDHRHNEINRMNVILDNVDDSDGSEHQIAKLKQSALVVRAHTYLNLISNYCPAYNEAIANNPNTGWFDKYTEDYDADLTRLTLQQSYDKIIADLEAAEQIDRGMSEPIYGSTLGAKGLLAMVYMSMANYDKAEGYIDEVLSKYEFLHDYNTLITGGYLDFDMLTNPEYIVTRASSAIYYNPIFTSNRTYCSEEFIQLFEDDDIRQTFLKDNNGKTIYFSPKRNLCSHSCSVPLLLLYKAEILARKGDVTNAMLTINKLRKLRFEDGTTYELSAGSSEEALDHVYDESRRELAFSVHIFNNIKRWNAHHNANISLTRYSIISEKENSISANHAKWTLPIPRHYISLNPEIVQNPRN